MRPAGLQVCPSARKSLDGQLAWLAPLNAPNLRRLPRERRILALFRLAEELHVFGDTVRRAMRSLGSPLIR